MLTRKDFEELAAIIREAEKDVYRGMSVDCIIDDIQERIAGFCALRNARFDRKRFDEACEPG